ncbi:MAG: hypothetical protein CVT92_07870 [Bacteroidetes bacterium HGW-Bacteroidetes-1]|jgi:ABC-type lipoprotein release transport system permease subunit|nr:MAG: hypothetical protein CVT92_07870 [Bacteroidetes bacterium HGW-Bacteroidetes-1]
MKNTYSKLAWRNIWRNKRRTLITASSILFAVLFALVMRSYQLGIYKSMTDSVVKTYMGFIQVHAKDYWDEKTLDYLLETNEDFINKVSSVNNVSLIAPHFESIALVSAGLQTKVAVVMGIDPEKENRMSKLSEKIIHYKLDQDAEKQLTVSGFSEELIVKINESRKKSYTSKEDAEKKLTNIIGKENTKKYLDLILKRTKIEGDYLSKNDAGVLIGERLSGFLKLSVGDTLVLMGQGYHGASVAGKYPIRGIVRIPNPELDNLIIYLSLNECQKLYSAENMLTSISLNLKDPTEMENTQAEIISALHSDKYEVMTWKEMNKILVQQIESDNYSGLIMLWILYIIVGFGVFGTVLMMTTERKKEFGVMVALGLQKYNLGFIVFIELLILSFIGILAGIIISLPIIRYFVVNPIELTGSMADMMESFGIEPTLPFAWQFDYFLAQSSSVLIIILIAILFPLAKVFTINTMKSLRG